MIGSHNEILPYAGRDKQGPAGGTGESPEAAPLILTKLAAQPWIHADLRKSQRFSTAAERNVAVRMER